MNLRQFWPSLLSPKIQLFSSDHQTLVIQGTKTALAAALSCWVASLLHLHEFYWSGISAVIVLQSNVGSTVTASRNRFIGTIIGAFLGFLGSLIGPQPEIYGITVLIGMVLCGLLNVKESSRLAGVTITLVMMVQRNGSHWAIALDRFFEVVLGIVVALCVSTFVLPRRAREHLREGLAQSFRALGDFFEAVMESFRDLPSDNLAEVKNKADLLLRTNDQLLRAARHEPSSGPASLEGLSLLAEFARSLYASLLALEISIKESHGDQFAQRLEPEMSKLIQDAKSGFLHVANCASNWRFDIPPVGVDLPQDIADLEARIAEGRSKSQGVPLEEMLRLYAVQLHLKELARTLRASRVQLHEAILENER